MRDAKLLKESICVNCNTTGQARLSSSMPKNCSAPEHQERHTLPRRVLSPQDVQKLLRERGPYVGFMTTTVYFNLQTSEPEVLR